MKALEKKAIKAAWERVVNAQVLLGKTDRDITKIKDELTEARCWLEVFFVVEKNES